MTALAVKKTILAILVLGVFCLFVLFTLWRSSPMQLGREAFSATGLPQRTLAEAQTLARTQNKPLLIDFSAYWCPACRRLDRDVLSDHTVKQAIEERYIFVRLDSEAEGTREHMKRYGLHGFPSLLLTDSEGELIRHLPQTYDVQQFLQAL